MIEKKFKIVVFGSTSLIGQSIIKLNPKNTVYTSRKKLNLNQNNWFKFSLNKKKKITLKKIKIGIFLISPRYLKKNFKKNIYEREYHILKKLLSLYNFEKFIYISSPTIYNKTNPIGLIKTRCENLLKKNKSKIKYLQIWRPFNLIGLDKIKLSDHFHNLLFKKMFILKNKHGFFYGCKNDERGYADLDTFTKNLLINSKKNINFVKDYGNTKSIKIIEILNIYKKIYFKITGHYFDAIFLKDKPYKNIINKKNINNFLLKNNNKQLFKNYLIKMIRLYKI
jgi:hypothetical protein